MTAPQQASTAPGDAAPVARDEARDDALLQSLRRRYQDAASRDDAEAKQALFKEAAYLGIQPDRFTVPL
jgi:hypothetical protein